jgi:hypothetical protein
VPPQTFATVQINRDRLNYSDWTKYFIGALRYPGIKLSYYKDTQRPAPLRASCERMKG